MFYNHRRDFNIVSFIVDFTYHQLSFYYVNERFEHSRVLATVIPLIWQLRKP